MLLTSRRKHRCGPGHNALTVFETGIETVYNRVSDEEIPFRAKEAGAGLCAAVQDAIPERILFSLEIDEGNGSVRIMREDAALHIHRRSVDMGDRRFFVVTGGAFHHFPGAVFMECVAVAIPSPAIGAVLVSGAAFQNDILP